MAKLVHIVFIFLFYILCTYVTFGKSNIPESPKNLTVTELNGNKWLFRWDTPKEDKQVFNYDVTYRRDASIQVMIQTSRTSIVIEVEEGGTYHARVRARNGFGISPWSPTIDFRSPVQKLIKTSPTNVTIIKLSGNQLKLSWGMPREENEVRRFELAYGKEENGPNAFSQRLFTTGNRVVINHVTGTYYAKVRAMNEYGIGPWSATVVYYSLPPERIYLLPEMFTATKFSQDTWKFTWEMPGQIEVTEYELAYGQDANGPNAYHRRIHVHGNNAIIHVADKGTHYARVRAMNELGYGPWSANVVFGSPATGEPGAPIIATGREILPGYFEVTWNAPKDSNNTEIKGYEVLYQNTKDERLSKISVHNVEHNSIVLSHLKPGNPYKVKVRAIYGGTGPWSGSIQLSSGSV